MTRRRLRRGMPENIARGVDFHRRAEDDIPEAKDEIHRFLAVIGQSSKTGLENGQLPEDYIGRFGIGLLSCFMVSDSIVIRTRPAEGGQGHIWTGLPDGTYTLEPMEGGEAGTTVILEAKPDSVSIFSPGRWLSWCAITGWPCRCRCI